MPLYDYKCSCGKRLDNQFNHVDEYPLCECGQKMTRVIGGHYVNPDLQPYLDPHIGDKPTWIKSKQHREKVMRQNGLAEIYGKGWI